MRRLQSGMCLISEQNFATHCFIQRVRAVQAPLPGRAMPGVGFGGGLGAKPQDPKNNAKEGGGAVTAMGGGRRTFSADIWRLALR